MHYRRPGFYRHGDYTAVEIYTRTRLAAMIGEADTGDARIDLQIVRGYPASALLDAAQHARLLVLGSRDHYVPERPQDRSVSTVSGTQRARWWLSRRRAPRTKPNAFKPLVGAGPGTAGARIADLKKSYTDTDHANTDHPGRPVIGLRTPCVRRASQRDEACPLRPRRS